jgi:hypothetical protein
MRAAVALFFVRSKKGGFMSGVVLDPLVREILEQLEADLRDAFEERAGIMDFDAGLERAHAECLALLSVIARNPAALCRARAIQFELDGTTRVLLTTNVTAARMHVGYVGGAEPRVVDLGDVLDREHGGLAAVCPSG